MKYQVYPREGKRSHPRRSRLLEIFIAGRRLTIRCLRFGHQARQNLTRRVIDILVSTFGKTPASTIKVAMNGKVAGAFYVPHSPEDTRYSVSSAIASLA